VDYPLIWEYIGLYTTQKTKHGYRVKLLQAPQSKMCTFWHHVWIFDTTSTNLGKLTAVLIHQIKRTGIVTQCNSLLICE